MSTHFPTQPSFCGHPVSDQQLQLIRDIVGDFPALSLSELAKTICELLDWRRPNGSLKNRECYFFLQQLKESGLLAAIPTIRTTAPQGPRSVCVDEQSDPQTPMLGSVGDYPDLRFELVSNPASRALFKQYIERYHYLSYRIPYGAQLRYFVRTARFPDCVLACLLFKSAAWRMAPRDRWIGWDDRARTYNLPRVVNNSRFLILPWVQIRHLASKILALSAHHLPEDWFSIYKIRPLLLESLVDTARFSGTCYRAANWIHLGTTQGRGRMDRTHQAHGYHPKEIFVYPLVRTAREQLCQIPQRGAPR